MTTKRRSVHCYLHKTRSPPSTPDTHGTTPLFCVAGLGHVSVKKNLFTGHFKRRPSDGAWVRARPPRGRKRARVCHGTVIVARCNVNIQDKDGGTTIHLTVIIGHVVVTKQLIATHCNVNLQTKKGETPIQWSAVVGNETVTELLIVTHRNVYLQSKDGSRPLGYPIDKKLLSTINKNVNS